MKAYITDWGLWTKKFVVVLIFLASVYLVLVLGPFMQDIIVSLILTFLLSIPVFFLRRKVKIPYFLSVLITLVCYFGIIFIVGVSIATPVKEFVTKVTDKIETEAPNVIQFYKNYSPETSSTDPFRVINDPISRLVNGESSGIDVSSAVKTVTDFFNGLINITTKFVLVHFLAILFLIELPRFYRGFKNSIPKLYKREYSILLKKVYTIFVKYTEGQLVIALVLGTATFFECTLLGISGPIVIGIFAAIMALIPIVGGLFILIPVFFLPLVFGSSVYADPLNPNFNLLLALLALVINLVIQLVVWNGIAPKISGTAVSLPVSVIIVGILVGTAVAGTLGAILSVPLIAVSKVLLEYIGMKLNGGEPYPGEKEPDFLEKNML